MREGLKDVLTMSKLGNQYVQSSRPWVLVKGSDSDRYDCNRVVIFKLDINSFMMSTSNASAYMSRKKEFIKKYCFIGFALEKLKGSKSTAVSKLVLYYLGTSCVLW